jgi:dihydroorotase
VSKTSRLATILVRGGTLVDRDGERRGDVLVAEGRVVALGEGLEAPRGALVLDAGGCYVSPGLVDLHAHLREPGGEAAETVETGSRAAALGGYTAVVAMPNTTPAIDSASVARDVLALGEDALCEVAVAGAITLGRAGERLAPLAEMAALGVRLFTDDGRGVQDAGLMRRALEYGRDLKVVLAEHCEDEALSAGGHMHEGAWSSRLGIAGQPALAEEAMVARDLALARLTGARLHLLHLSSAGSIRLVRQAKAEGLAVTCEVTPHHLSLTDAEVASFDARFKVNPPLREQADLDALREACGEGVVDAIATDHAPHPPEAKEEPFELAPAGMLGLETALAVSFEALCTGERPWCTPQELFSLLTSRPAQIAGLEEKGQGGSLVEGRAANLCVFDPAEAVVVSGASGASRSRNTAFEGVSLKGRVRHTLYRGEVVVRDAMAQR